MQACFSWCVDATGSRSAVRACVCWGYTSTGSVCWFERAATLGMYFVACPRGATYNVASATLEFVEMHRCGVAARPKQQSRGHKKHEQIPTRGGAIHAVPGYWYTKFPMDTDHWRRQFRRRRQEIAPRAATREATKTPKPAPYAASSAAPASAKTRARPCRRARAPPRGPYWWNRRTRRH